MDFWHSNVFGGFWASFILFINWILIFVTGFRLFLFLFILMFCFSFSVCCNSSVRASTITFFWHLITLIAFGLLIMFDTIFILNPTTCLLTFTCSSQPKKISLNFLMQRVPQFSTYTNYDSKKFFLQIQLICASIVFFFTCTYIFIFLRCQTKLQERLRRGNSDYTTSSSSSSSNDDSPPKFSMSSTTDRNSYAYYF